MPNLDYSPYPGSWSSLVRTRVLRGLNLQQTIKSVRDVRKGIQIRSIEKYYDYWRQTKQAANNLRRSSGNRVIGDVIKSSRSNRPKLVRVGITFEFDNPETEELQKVGFDIDIPIGLTKLEMLKLVTNKIFEWLFQYYKFKSLVQFQTQEFMDSIYINTIEGL